jgi:hypothetical protein
VDSPQGFLQAGPDVGPKAIGRLHVHSTGRLSTILPNSSFLFREMPSRHTRSIGTRDWRDF